jgi:hypothetical protein
MRTFIDIIELFGLVDRKQLAFSFWQWHWIREHQVATRLKGDKNVSFRKIIVVNHDISGRRNSTRKVLRALRRMHLMKRPRTFSGRCAFPKICCEAFEFSE